MSALLEVEVDEFWRSGFLVLPGRLTPDEVESLREACESPGLRPERERRGGAAKLLHLLEATARDPRFLALARDPRITEPISQLLGPDLALQHSKVATKPLCDTGRGAAPWHQDFAFFPHTHPGLVAAMVMLDDADAERGCLHVVPGSHHLGPLDHSDDGFFTGVCRDLPPGTDSDAGVALEVHAGDITLHHCLTLHRSPENRSGSPRRAVVFEVRAADALQLAGDVWVDTGLVLRGHATPSVRCENLHVALPRRAGVDFPYGSAWNQEGGYARGLNFRTEHLPQQDAAVGLETRACNQEDSP